MRLSVHSDFVDPTKPTRNGYSVHRRPNPTMSLEDDVAHTATLAAKDGPAILVGHSTVS